MMTSEGNLVKRMKRREALMHFTYMQMKLVSLSGHETPLTAEQKDEKLDITQDESVPQPPITGK